MTVFHLDSQMSQRYPAKGCVARIFLEEAAVTWLESVPGKFALVRVQLQKRHPIFRSASDDLRERARPSTPGSSSRGILNRVALGVSSGLVGGITNADA